MLNGGYKYLEPNSVLTLYDSGNEFIDITGGWNLTKNNYATATKNLTNITLSVSGGASSAVMTTTKEIDISKYSYIIVFCNSTASGQYGTQVNIVIGGSLIYASGEVTNTITNAIGNITNMNQSYQIKISTDGGGSSISGNRYRTTVITKVILVPK